MLHCNKVPLTGATMLNLFINQTFQTNSCGHIIHTKYHTFILRPRYIKHSRPTIHSIPETIKS